MPRIIDEQSGKVLPNQLKKNKTEGDSIGEVTLIANCYYQEMINRRKWSEINTWPRNQMNIDYCQETVTEEGISAYKSLHET